MIARFWHGAVPAAKAEGYLNYLNKTGIPDYQDTPGNQGVCVLKRVEGEIAHFLIMTLWVSEEAIRTFAGEPINRARYYPEDMEFLIEQEREVTHYEVVTVPNSGQHI